MTARPHDHSIATYHYIFMKDYSNLEMLNHIIPNISSECCRTVRSRAALRIIAAFTILRSYNHAASAPATFTVSCAASRNQE